MEPLHFDRLSRVLGTAPSRRAALAAVLGAITGLVGGTAAEAKPKEKTKKKCKKGQKKCGKRCIPKAKCCRDANCKNGNICKNGECRCPTGSKPCADGCIPREDCCQSIDCGPCESCQDGTCEPGCDTGQTCQGGTCRCTAESCAGCCDGDTCRGGDTNAFCGRNGATCDACGQDESCTAGACGCGAGREVCAGQCVNTQTDNDFCGNCATACDPGQDCQGGVCSADICASGCTYTSVQAAVDAASPGATIYLGPGTYIGSIRISRDLTLIGAGAASTILEATSTILTITEGATVEVRAVTVTRGSFHGINVASESTLTVTNCIVANNRGSGIRTSGTLTVVDTDVRDNVFPGSGGAGIDVSFSGTATIKGTSTIRNNTVLHTDNESPIGARGGGILSRAFDSTLILEDEVRVTGNTVHSTHPTIPPRGGGVYNNSARAGSMTIAATVTIASNTPDDCVSPENSPCP